MAAKRLIGILTGGGDVPGLNVAIKAAVLRAQGYEVALLGLRQGWMSMLNINPDDPASAERWTIALDPDRVRTIDRTGGTFLHTSRVNPGNVKASQVPAWIRDSDKSLKPSGTVDCTRHALRVLDYLGLEALIAIGGDDTLSFAHRLHQEGFRVVGIPKTVDNDVFGTDYCIGFSTAVTRSVKTITYFRTSLGSHERIGVVELFGRNSGETSLVAAYLANADRAIISEVPFDIEKLVGFLVEDRRRNPSNYAIVTVSEGAYPVDGEIVQRGEADAYGHQRLGGIGLFMAEAIQRHGLSIMYQQLTYIMRTGPPDSLDRMVALSFGNMALDEVAMGNAGQMVALQKGVYTTVPLDLVVSGQRRVDVAALYDSENYRPRVGTVRGKPMFLS